MNAKRIAAVVLSSLFALSDARAQGFLAPPLAAPPTDPVANNEQVTVPPFQVMPQMGMPPAGPPQPGTAVVGGAPTLGPVGPGGYDMPGVSNWIRRDNGPCCNGPWGKHSEIGQELYLRTGVSLPIGNELISRNCTTGFTVEGGARTLFFNHSFTRAWTIETGILSTWNSGIANPEPVTINGLRPGVIGFQNFNVSVRDVNRTMVNLGFGREWFSEPAKDQPVHWRIGADGGFRYGSMRVNLNELVHRTDVIGGIYFGGGALFEYPCRNYILHLGLRSEYAYTWSDIFQRASDLGEVNILLSGGIRY